MYPYDIFPGFDLYSLFFLLALCSAIISFRIMSDRLGLEAKIHNLCIYSGIVAIAGGYPSALLLQACYDYIATGVFDFTSGMTFYGGFIGGALTFLIVYFGIGHFFDREKLRLDRFFFVSDIATCSVVLAHATGRIGCLFAGCCRGAITGAWYGVYNVHLSAKTVPIPLFESLFLFALLGYLIFRVFHKKTYNLPIYLAGYGVWRFFIEYLRFDDRGETIVSFLSPSQLTAIVLFVVGIVLFIVMLTINRRSAQAIAAADTASEVMAAEITETEDAISDDETDDSPAEVTEAEAENEA